VCVESCLRIEARNFPDMKAPGVALIGCGLIGQKRFNTFAPGTVRAACDLDIERARRIAVQSPGCLATTSIAEALASSDVGLVVVATVNASLVPVACQAVEAGKHVVGGKARGNFG